MKPLHRRLTRLLLMFLPLAIIAGTAAAAIAPDQIRRNTNSERLQLMHHWMQPKVAAVISDLESHGYKPLIDKGVWRSPAQQVDKVKKGYSKTKYSYHTNTFLFNKPASYAADIVDVRWGWTGDITITNKNDRSRAMFPYWLKLASSAESHRCVTGIYWGLSEHDRARLRLAVATREWTYKGRLGWDTAHVQPHYFTYAEARAGKLPR